MLHFTLPLVLLMACNIPSTEANRTVSVNVSSSEEPVDERRWAKESKVRASSSPVLPVSAYALLLADNTWRAMEKNTRRNTDRYSMGSCLDLGRHILLRVLTGRGGTSE